MTKIVILNTAAVDVTSTFQVHSRTGTLLKSVPILVRAEGSTRFTIADPGSSVINSWGALDAGTATVRGVATFELRSANGALVTTAGVLDVEAASSFILPVDISTEGITSDTAIAVANVTKNSVQVVLQLISETGFGSPSVTGQYAKFYGLESQHQVADFVSNIWPQLKGGGFKGTLVVAVIEGVPPSNSLVVTALTVNDGALSAVQAIPAVIGCAGCWDY